MTETLEKIKSRLEALPNNERAELAVFLLNSLEPADEDMKYAWREEVARRVAQIRAGQAVGRSASEVFAEMRERYP